MSLINEALKNIDARSRDAGTLDQDTALPAVSSLPLTFYIYTSENDESYASRFFAFPCLCFIFAFIWCVGLGATLAGLDFDKVKKFGFSVAIHHDFNNTDYSMPVIIGVSEEAVKTANIDHAPTLFADNVASQSLIISFDEIFGNHKNDYESLVLKEITQKTVQEVPKKLTSAIEGKYSASKSVEKNTMGNRIFTSELSGIEVSADKAKARVTKLESLKKQFYLALDNDRLTKPVRASAWYFLQQIQRTDDMDAFYKKGMSEIESRYRMLIEQGIYDGNTSSAAKYLDRLVLVSQRDEYIQQYAPRIEKLKKFENKYQGQRLSIEKTNNTFVESFALARQHVDLGHYHRANTLLEQEINTVPLNRVTIASVELWFDVLVNLQQYEKAKKIHETISQYSWSERWDESYRAALLLSYTHDHDTALQFLARKNSNALSEKSLRLIAGLYQKEARYKSAKKTYKVLIEKYGDNSTYWLGYAVSLDALSENTIALDAFKKTRSIGGLSPKLGEYVYNRIRVLGRSNSVLSEKSRKQDTLNLSSNERTKSFVSW